MNKKNKITKYIYIGLFAALYLSVALVSGIHAVQFFSLANKPALGVMLAITFEIGQAAVLFSLLTNPNQRKKFMTWVQLSIFSLVQVLGNVFSSYKYIVTNSIENLRYFREPVFVWTDLPDQTCNVIITYLVGGILPISALLLTEMMTSYLYGEDNTKQIGNEQITEKTLPDKKDEGETEEEDSSVQEVALSHSSRTQQDVEDNSEQDTQDIQHDEEDQSNSISHEQDNEDVETKQETVENTNNEENDGDAEGVQEDVERTDESNNETVEEKEEKPFKPHFLNLN